MRSKSVSSVLSSKKDLGMVTAIAYSTCTGAIVEYIPAAPTTGGVIIGSESGSVSIYDLRLSSRYIDIVALTIQLLDAN